MQQTLNIGILAHVDAGKTSLTEQILLHAGVIGTIGHVDKGTTHTDTLELERQRGITIQSAVVSFRLDGLTVNLIDTPGHTDFVAEVVRALQVLDAVIVVVSAVEGVQPQTRRLVQAVRDAGLPLLLFGNKIDRSGARSDKLQTEIERALGIRTIAMSCVRNLGTRSAAVIPFAMDDGDFSDGLVNALADHSDEIIERFVSSPDGLDVASLLSDLQRQIRDGHVVPLFFGSAITGAGVRDLLEGIPRLVPGVPDRSRESLSGVVFKIQRTKAGEKVALVRLFSGRFGIRDHITYRRRLSDGRQEHDGATVTGIERFRDGSILIADEACAGNIVRVHGLKDLRVGDILGDDHRGGQVSRLALPTLESIVTPDDPADATRMYAALQQLEEQDPLISVHRGTRDRTVSLRLYGEVQKEVIEATLRDDFGIVVSFAPSRIVCIERVIGTSDAGEEEGANPFGVTVFIRIEPGPPNSGIAYHRELGIVPLGFYRAIEETVFATLEEGLHGWPVRDCVVTLTRVTYPTGSVAGDYRHLTPLVLMSALKEAGTEVCEPVERFTLDVPLGVLGDAYGALAAAGAAPEAADQLASHGRIVGTIPTAEVHRFEQLLPGWAGGEGVFTSEPAGYRPVQGDAPARKRTDFDPLNRKYYLAQISQA